MDYGDAGILPLATFSGLPRSLTGRRSIWDTSGHYAMSAVSGAERRRPPLLRIVRREAGTLVPKLRPRAKAGGSVLRQVWRLRERHACTVRHFAPSIGYGHRRADR